MGPRFRSDEHGRFVGAGRVRPAGVALILCFVAGCTTTPIQPAYTPEELQAKCIRTSGWWRANLDDGFCEYELPMP